MPNIEWNDSWTNSVSLSCWWANCIFTSAYNEEYVALRCKWIGEFSWTDPHCITDCQCFWSNKTMADLTLIRECKCSTVIHMIQYDGCLCWHHVTCNMSDNQHQNFSGDGYVLALWPEFIWWKVQFYHNFCETNKLNCSITGKFYTWQALLYVYLCYVRAVWLSYLIH